MTTYDAALAAARAELRQAGVESAALDARLLLADAAGLDLAGLIARADDALPALAERAFASHLMRRISGEPVARICGAKEFWSLRFQIDAATLVPRPETETLVEAVAAEVRRSLLPAVTIGDLGTGSGAILIALLTELPQARGIGTDISEKALATARRNAERLGVAGRIEFRCADFAEGPDGPFDIVVANPPYIPSGAIRDLPRDVRDFDPRIALDGGEDGLAAYRSILARLDRLVAPGGLLAFEVGHDQGDRVGALCSAAGLVEVTAVQDLSGIARVVIGRRSVSGILPRNSKKALGKPCRSG